METYNRLRMKYKAVKLCGGSVFIAGDMRNLKDWLICGSINDKIHILKRLKG